MCGLRRNTAMATTGWMILGLALVSCALTNAVEATTIDDFQLEGSCGLGTNRAALVVDFEAGNGDADSFAFEVWFDTETIGGFDLLDAVRDGTANAFDYTTEFDGAFVKSLSYLGYETTSNSATGESLMYWTSNNAGDTWDLAWAALGDTTLGDNQSLGWLSQVILWYDNGNGNWYSDPPMSEWSVPVAPIPEPASLIVLVSGLMALLAWGRRRRRG